MDVFATSALSGNPLAVVPDADELDVATMRQIAVEFNLSETTFVLSPTLPEAARRLRSFTPSGDEVVGAGHNVLGAWWWLAANGTVPTGGSEIRQQLGGRSSPLRIEGSGLVERVAMEQGPAEISESVDLGAKLPTALRMNAHSIDVDDGPRVASTGVAHLMVEVRDRELVDGASPDPPALRQMLAEVGAQGCYLFTRDTVDPFAHAYARFFNPTVGIREDPATGSAAGPLAALLLERGDVDASSTVVVEQGFSMGRPSRLEVLVDHDRVELSGSCVIVGEGVLHLPAPVGPG